MKQSELNIIKKEIASLSCCDNLCCVLLYGSLIKRGIKQSNDADLIIIVKDIHANLSDLFDYIYKKFNNPDFHIYSQDEVENNLSFFTREYVLEYLAKAYCLYNKNILKEKFATISRSQYRVSILIRSIEHMQMVRKAYFSNKYDGKYKSRYIKKYSLRIAKNILLFKDAVTYDEINSKTENEVFHLLMENTKQRKEISNNNFEKFNQICNILIECRKELNFNITSLLSDRPSFMRHTVFTK